MNGPDYKALVETENRSQAGTKSSPMTSRSDRVLQQKSTQQEIGIVDLLYWYVLYRAPSQRTLLNNRDLNTTASASDEPFIRTRRGSEGSTKRGALSALVLPDCVVLVGFTSGRHLEQTFLAPCCPTKSAQRNSSRCSIYLFL
jgi:hypothetical protein